MKMINDNNVITIMSSQNKPVASVEPGEIFCIETKAPGFDHERIENIKKTGKYPKRMIHITGPVEIKGSKAGDVLKIKILEIKLKDTGRMWMGPSWLSLNENVAKEPVIKEVKIKNNYIEFNKGQFISTKPMIGTIGVAPKEGEVECLFLGEHGSNMDMPLICDGSIVYLPVFHDGALLSIGDVHASMGAGEIFGTGIETGSFVTLKVEVIRSKYDYPWVETKDKYALIANEKTVELACKKASLRALEFIEDFTGLDSIDSYAFAAQFCHLKLAQVVNPSLMTVYMEIDKNLLSIAKK